MTNTIVVDEPQVEVTATEDVVQVNVIENVVQLTLSNTGPQGPAGTQVLSGSVDPSSVIGRIGDQYINTSSGTIFGPKTEMGWGTGVVLGTGLLISDVAYTHYQTVTSTVWTVTHSLDFFPNITVVDLNGNVVEGSYQYNGNTITATFSEAIAGAAYLS